MYFFLLEKRSAECDDGAMPVAAVAGPQPRLLGKRLPRLVAAWPLQWRKRGIFYRRCREKSNVQWLRRLDRRHALEEVRTCCKLGGYVFSTFVV
jgi:hypothetical protein